jgi:hypothetical protein
MPFTPYQSSFDLDTLIILQNAFDQAWAEVAASPGVSVDEEAARTMIAKSRKLFGAVSFATLAYLDLSPLPKPSCVRRHLYLGA